MACVLTKSKKSTIHSSYKFWKQVNVEVTSAEIPSSTHEGTCERKAIERVDDLESHYYHLVTACTRPV